MNVKKQFLKGNLAVKPETDNVQEYEMVVVPSNSKIG